MKSKAKNGYTLLEMIVYVAILAVIVIVSVGSVMSGYRSYGMMKVERQIASNGEAAMERMVRDVRSASQFGTTTGVLDLSTEKFVLSGNTLQVQPSGGPAQDLTSDVNITNLSFYSSSTPVGTGTSTIITIIMTLQAGSGDYSQTKNFYGSAVLRGAY